MKQTFLLLSITLLLTGCLEEDTLTEVYLQNNSSHEVLLRPYQSGAIDNARIVSLQPGNKFRIENTYQRGKTKVPIYFFDYFRGIDSIQVIWDNTYSVTHMISDSFTSVVKYIAFGNVRNLGNGIAYPSEIRHESKRSITWELNYSFTEQDYEYAKN